MILYRLEAALAALIAALALVAVLGLVGAQVWGRIAAWPGGLAGLPSWSDLGGDLAAALAVAVVATAGGTVLALRVRNPGLWLALLVQAPLGLGAIWAAGLAGAGAPDRLAGLLGLVPGLMALALALVAWPPVPLAPLRAAAADAGAGQGQIWVRIVWPLIRARVGLALIATAALAWAAPFSLGLPPG